MSKRTVPVPAIAIPSWLAPNPVVLGIDPSTKTGLSIVSVDEDGRPVVQKSSVCVPKTRGYERISDIAHDMLALLAAHEPACVVIEGYAYANHFTLVPLVEIGTILRWLCVQKGVDLYIAQPASLKKFATGKGNAKKDQVMLAVYKRWGLEFKTNDECDAFVLATMGLARSHAVSGLTKDQQSSADALALFGCSL